MAVVEVPSLFDTVPSFVVQIALIVGAIFLLIVILKVLRFVYRYFIRSPINPKKFGSWAGMSCCCDVYLIF